MATFSPIIPIPNPLTDQDLDQILKLLAVHDKMEKLSDVELVDACIKHVWGPLILGSPQEMLLNELMTRFEEKAGIKRDDEGNVIESSS